MDGNYAVDYNYTNIVKNNFPVTVRQLIKADINLNIKGLRYGASVSWTSSHPELLTDAGQLILPYEAEGDTVVVVDLTCTTQKDNYAYNFKRQVRIRINKESLPETAIASLPYPQKGGSQSYSLSGMSINISSPSNTLPLMEVQGVGLRGIYIVNGKKVMVR